MKKRPVSNDDFFEGFFQWLDSEKGQTSMEAMEAVAAALKGAHVDTRKRRIVWPDGKRLTIDQSAQRIQKQSGEDLKAIKSHVVGWLEMDFEPKGPNEKQMEIFEAQIEDWIKDYQAGKPDRSRHTRAENSVLSSYLHFSIENRSYTFREMTERQRQAWLESYQKMWRKKGIEGDKFRKTI